MKDIYLRLALLAFGLYFGAISAASDQYGWTQVKVANLGSMVKVTGRVVPQEGALSIESARVAGRILNILAREGDRVKPGDSLFSINSAECLSINEEKRVAEKRQIDGLLSGVLKREKQLGLKVFEDRCEIVSSYTGSVTKRPVESGATFNIGDTLMTILDTKRLSVELDLSECDLSRVRPGQLVKFRLATNPTKTYETAVKAVVPAIDTSSRTARVRLNPVQLPSQANLDGLIFGEIETGSKEPVFLVPSPALVFGKNSRYIIKGSYAQPMMVEAEVLGESNGLASIRPKKSGELAETDRIATTHVIFLFEKMSMETKQP